MPVSEALLAVFLSNPAPGQPAGPAELAEPVEPVEPTELDAALTELRAAEVATNSMNEGSLARLEAALQTFHNLGPVLADDERARSARLMAQLSLARAYLARDDRSRAATAMDEAIRMTRNRSLPTEEFGPSLSKLRDARAVELGEAGRGNVSIQCSIPCRVILDETPTAPEMDGLLLGRYRLWVLPRDPSAAEPWRTHLSVAVPGETVTLTYPGRNMASGGSESLAPLETPVAPPPVLTPAAPAARADDPPGRILPRWASLSLMAAGAVGAAVGGVLLGLDGTCQGSDKSLDTCLQVYSNRGAAIGLLAGGASLLAVGTPVLVADEIRQARGKRVALRPGGFTVRF